MIINELSILTQRKKLYKTIFKKSKSKINYPKKENSNRRIAFSIDNQKLNEILRKNHESSNYLLKIIIIFFFR